MEIGPDKTKVMTNHPNDRQREIKVKRQRLEEVENFKYLGAIISNEGSKPEILSRIAQTTTALSRPKVIWRDKNISLASKVKLMRTLIFSTFLYEEVRKRIQNAIGVHDDLLTMVWPLSLELCNVLSNLWCINLSKSPLRITTICGDD